MIAAVDVHYKGLLAATACALFDGWQADTIKSEHCQISDVQAPYIPGAFFLRELPCISEVLELTDYRPDLVIVDGYVWLEKGRPGLGQHLFLHLGEQIPVVGVAKNSFDGNDAAVDLLRGQSKQPLYVTASGIDVDEACEGVRSMVGEYRIPDHLKHVDRLCREAL